MKRALALVISSCGLALSLAGCSVEIHQAPSPRADKGATASEEPSRAPEAQTDCTNGDCDSVHGMVSNEVVCSPLPTAVAVFHGLVEALPGFGLTEDLPLSGGRTITDVVIDVVDRCGYQVMADIAYQYPEPISTGLMRAAASALGEIGSLPMGLRCAELKALGLGPKQAVDYWFASGAPALMDADLNGVPCETVWTDVARYIPLYY